MVCAAEVKLTMLLVQAEQGVYLALVPQDLSAAEVDAGFRELGIEPCQVVEITDWETASVGLAVARLPWAGAS